MIQDLRNVQVVLTERVKSSCEVINEGQEEDPN